jgi:hypothetical protein
MSPKSKARTTKRRPKSRHRPGPARDQVEEYFSRERYTPPKRAMPRLRPSWHKPVGWGLLALGVLVVLVNYAEEFEIHLMPGGHSEAYFLLGIVVAVWGTWWLGVFDRPEKG